MAMRSIKLVTDYEDNKENTRVVLDGEIIYTIDKATYMGHRRPCEKEILKVLSEKLGREVTGREFNTATMLEQIDDEAA